MAATIVGTRYRRVAPGTGFTLSGDNPQFVIPGLDPGIYEPLPVDGRIKPGHDDILHGDPTQIDFALVPLPRVCREEPPAAPVIRGRWRAMASRRGRRGGDGFGSAQP